MIFRNALFFTIILFTSCNHIESNETLKQVDIERLKSLKLLDKGESVIKFYSEFKNEIAGNFFTEKRIAKYWLDEKDKSQNQISFAFYRDIKSIDTVYYAGSTYCPFMLITKNDNTKFKVFVDGEREEIKSFFEEALDLWAKNKNGK